MKTIYKIIILALASALFLNCQKENELVLESSNEMVFEDEGGTGEVVFQAGDAWNLIVESNAAKWCSLSQRIGTEGHHSIKVTVKKNMDAEDRDADITLTCGSRTEVIKVFQKLNNNVNGRVNLKMTHNASVLDFPKWFGNHLAGSVVWEEGGAKENYVMNYSHDYGNDDIKTSVFDIEHVDSFFIEDIESVSNLSIRY